MRRLRGAPPPEGMLHVVRYRDTPSIKFSGTHLYTWVERGTVRVKCLAREHTQSSVPGQGSNPATLIPTNHETISPLRQKLHDHFIYYLQALSYTSILVLAHGYIPPNSFPWPLQEKREEKVDNSMTQNLNL